MPCRRSDVARSKDTTPSDPLGKRALYGVPAFVGENGDESPNSDTSTGEPGVGKRALYSGAHSDMDGTSGAFTVRCQRCQRVSRIGLLELVILQFPVGVWIPRGRFDRRMTCPSCRRRAWCSVSLRHG